MLNPFISLIKTTQEVRLQDAQYKILHNIYPTVKNLFKWKIKDSQLCQTCGEVDDLKHSIFECHHARTTFENFQNLLRLDYNIIIEQLTYENILMGTHSTLNNTQAQLSLTLDTILILIKRKLILNGEEKYTLTISDLKGLITSQIKLEKTIMNNSKKFQLKWRYFERDTR